MMSMKAVLIGFLAVLVIPATTAQAADTSPIMGDGGVVRLVSNPVGTNSWPVYVMKKYELDKKHGFTLQLVPAANNSFEVSAIVSGNADINPFQWPDIARMRKSGVDVIAIAPFLTLGADYILTPPNSTLKTVGDLKGKVLGVTTTTSVEWLVMQAVGQKIYHFDADTDSTVHEAAVSVLSGLLEQGKLDATHMFNNLEPALVTTGKARVMIRMKTLVAQLGLPDTPFTMWGALASYAKAHTSDVKAFVAAYRDAMEILDTDDAPWQVHGKELQMSDEAVRQLETEMRVDVTTKFTPETESDIRKVFEVLLATAGPEHLGVSELPAGFISLDYQ